ncbi:molybdopterin-dependent oxidoreductase [Candidatus Nitronereus thalassa]|uniref:Molybdopterin-dependent oxidoreductase n=1 Tax=Candidatus Nitronereus thalassa TaxID=3020898 RepID=A0ABU3K4H5_9BACT|nr:molybdopterin-dependent oxidoreductase [Candidatus Nitronereus thalassa]MDT7041283.1 molybdopterin-dependent oxidoreductase [Candidatus Nitronereus thalassa]
MDTETISNLGAEFHVEEISVLMPGMGGLGIRVAGLLELTALPIGSDHVTFSSADGQYSASLTLDQAKKFGILLYQVDKAPLPADKGGPFRLVTPGLGDLCANVKNVGQITVTVGLGKDTRPEERSC